LVVRRWIGGPAQVADKTGETASDSTAFRVIDQIASDPDAGGVEIEQ